MKELICHSRSKSLAQISIDGQRRIESCYVDLQLEPQLQEEAPEQPQSPAIVILFGG